MLVSSRKTGEEIVIGSDIRVTVLAIVGGRVRIGIEADKHIPIMRAEIMGRLQGGAAVFEVNAEQTLPAAGLCPAVGH